MFFGCTIQATKPTCVLSADPDLNRDEFLLMISCGVRRYGGRVRIGVFKSGKKEWSFIEEAYYEKDFVYSNGLFYV